MKELAKYLGKVIKLNEPPQASVVTLTEVSTGKTIETSAITEELISHSLTTGDDFEIVIQQSVVGSIDGIIRKIEPEINI